MNDTIYAGMMTGLISQSLTWPLEYIKIKKQINGKNVFDNIKYEYNKYGSKAFTRGFQYHIMGGIPRVTLRFYLYDYLNNNGFKDKKYISGLIAGFVETFTIYGPSEFLKIQDMKRDINKKNNFDVFNKIYKNPSILYKGTLLTATRQGLTQMTVFSFFDRYNQFYVDKLGNNYGKIITGSLGGITAVMINNPIDVIKSNVQFNKKSLLYNTKNIYKNDGLIGFWKGSLIRSSRMAPLYSLNFFLFDYFKNKV